LPNHSDNLKIAIQRINGENDKDKVRHYLKKLIILTDKRHLPTLFMAVDLSYLYSWHCLYKLNHDKDCPFVSLRILGQQRHDGFHPTQTLRVQILEPVYSGTIHERLIALSKIQVIQEFEVVVPRNRGRDGQLPIDMTRLLIKRKGRDSVREFVMHYYSHQEEDSVKSQIYDD
jgi:hypothetical protein